MDCSKESISQGSSADANDMQKQGHGAIPNVDDVVNLSDSIFLYPTRKMTTHGNVFEGEIRSGVYGVRSCAVKFSERSEENVREARILAKLGSHTHVISIIQSGVYKDVFEEHVYIALDKCHKLNLRQYFEHRKELGLVYDVNIGLEYSKQIIAGMKYVHENLIFHKDLKPSNILLTLDKSTIKLADFGLSQEIKSTSSKVFCSHQFGTNGFRPPESFGNSWASLKSDIFSLGLVFYFILSNAMSPLGDDFHLWTHNTQNGVFDTSNLLVPNLKSTEHLIALMLSQERCCRPSIWQVAEHPCWNGNEIKRKFDYGYEEEIDDSDFPISESQIQESGNSEIEIERVRKFLKAVEQMGFRRPPASETSIIIFDNKSRHLQRFNLRKQTVIQMQEYNDEMKRNVFFASVSLDEHIYVLMRPKMYRINHCNITATWERMPNLIDDHGLLSPAVVVSGAIIIAGGSNGEFTKSVTKYNSSLNRWEKMNNKPLSTSYSVSVASQGCVYCLGGWIEDSGITERVERLNVLFQSWDEVSSMTEARYRPSAVEYDGKIIVAGGSNRDKQELGSVEKYDPDVNQWTIMKPMKLKRWSSCFRCHLIEGSIYAVGPFEKGIEKYQFEKDKWEYVQLPDQIELDIVESVSVNQTK